MSQLPALLLQIPLLCVALLFVNQKIMKKKVTIKEMIIYVLSDECSKETRSLVYSFALSTTVSLVAFFLSLWVYFSG